jgi:hypothetical protein
MIFLAFSRSIAPSGPKSRFGKNSAGIKIASAMMIPVPRRTMMLSTFALLSAALAGSPATKTIAASRIPFYPDQTVANRCSVNEANEYSAENSPTYAFDAPSASDNCRNQNGDHV